MAYTQRKIGILTLAKALNPKTSGAKLRVYERGKNVLKTLLLRTLQIASSDFRTIIHLKLSFAFDLPKILFRSATLIFGKTTLTLFTLRQYVCYRLLSKFHFIVKVALFAIFATKFSNKSKFRKKSNV